MRRVVLGLDTSNYVTSIAAVDLDGNVVLDARQPLLVPEGKRGLQQSAAVFQHEKNLPALMTAHQDFFQKHTVAAICASTAPRPGPGSYMPVFVVGRGHGVMCAHIAGVPFFITNHQDGHIAAAKLGSPLKRDTRFLALHLSGGTTEVLLVERQKSRLLGGSLDLFAGQLVDRAGVALGLAFPSGPHLELLAAKGEAKGLLGVSMQGMNCHLSGAEAQVYRWMEEGILPPADIAAEIYDFLIRLVTRLIEAAWRQTGCSKALLAGGVASSERVRQGLLERLRRKRVPVAVTFAAPGLAGDNAVGVAWIGLKQYDDRGEG